MLCLLFKSLLIMHQRIGHDDLFAHRLKPSIMSYTVFFKYLYLSVHKVPCSDFYGFAERHWFVWITMLVCFNMSLWYCESPWQWDIYKSECRAILSVHVNIIMLTRKVRHSSKNCILFTKVRVWQFQQNHSRTNY